MTLKVVFFTQLFCPFAGGTPWKPTSAQLLCGPRVWRPQPMVKDIEGYPIFALGAQNPDKTPACRPIGPPPWPPLAPPRPPG